MNTQRKYKGFTIVELLIVIVVIAILAAISIVAYNGVQERARFVAMRSDLSSLNKAIQLYYAKYGSYPVTPASGTGCSSGNWCGFDQATSDNFIPGLVPEFISATPQLPSTNTNNDTYLYRSPTGTDYKLIRYYGVAMTASEQSSMLDLRAVCGGAPQTDRWGYWSSDTSKCW